MQIEPLGEHMGRRPGGCRRAHAGDHVLLHERYREDLEVVTQQVSVGVAIALQTRPAAVGSRVLVVSQCSAADVETGHGTDHAIAEVLSHVGGRLAAVQGLDQAANLLVVGVAVRR